MRWLRWINPSYYKLKNNPPIPPIVLFYCYYHFKCAPCDHTSSCTTSQVTDLGALFPPYSQFSRFGVMDTQQHRLISHIDPNPNPKSNTTADVFVPRSRSDIDRSCNASRISPRSESIPDHENSVKRTPDFYIKPIPAPSHNHDSNKNVTDLCNEPAVKRCRKI